MLELLLSKGASIGARDFNGNTPLDLAKAAEHLEVVTFLEAKKKLMPHHSSPDSD